MTPELRVETQIPSFGVKTEVLCILLPDVAVYNAEPGIKSTFGLKGFLKLRSDEFQLIATLISLPLGLFCGNSTYRRFGAISAICSTLIYSGDSVMKGVQTEMSLDTISRCHR